VRVFVWISLRRRRVTPAAVHENSCGFNGLLGTLGRGSQFPGIKSFPLLFVARLFCAAADIQNHPLIQVFAASRRYPRATSANKQALFCVAARQRGVNFLDAFGHGGHSQTGSVQSRWKMRSVDCVQSSSVAYAFVLRFGAVLPLRQLVCELCWPNEYLRQRPRPPAQDAYRGKSSRPNLRDDREEGARWQ
jgi:hypothetical protein